MPKASEVMLDQLGVPAEDRCLRCLASSANDSSHAPRAGTPLPAPSGIFPRIELSSEATKSPAAAAGTKQAKGANAKKEAP
jgi:hypothetical protein